jgi:hypothetical protein
MTGRNRRTKAMRKTIERCIIETTVKSGKVSFVKGLPVVTNEKTDVFDGALTDEKALKEIQKLYGTTAVVIEKSEESNRYEISVEDFKKYATKVVDAPPATDATQEGEAKTE